MAEGGDPDSWQTLAVELLEAAALCLDQHTTEGAPELQFPSVGDPINAGCDYMSTWWSEWVPYSPTFPTPMSEARVCEVPEWGGQLHLKIRWCGYPHIEPLGAGAMKRPDPAEMTVWSAKINAAVRALQCCLPGLYADGALFANPNFPLAPPALALPVIWQRISPYREGMWAGVDLSVLLDMESCCAMPIIDREGSGA